VQPSVVNPLSFLFYPVPSRIHFSPAEQKVLELALLNESDLEISEDLGVSVDAVKKTWRRAYQRAARLAPLLLIDLPRFQNRGFGAGSGDRTHKSLRTADFKLVED
jgi:hypothetical protein